MLLSSSVCASACREINLCDRYYPQVMRETHYLIGMEGPHALFMAQIQHESGCHEGITSFDQGRGLAQFMDETAKWIHSREPALREISRTADPYNPAWAIRALILYDDYLYDAMKPCEGWYFALRAYNGGQGILKREITRAGCCDRKKVEAECRRKVITLKNGKKLDMCKDVNLRYYPEIEKKSKRWDYWTED